MIHPTQMFGTAQTQEPANRSPVYTTQPAVTIKEDYF